MSIDFFVVSVVGFVLIVGGGCLLREARKYSRTRKSRSASTPDGQVKPSVATGEHGITHITPVGGNIFLDLGFPPEEAERLKAESDHRIDQEKAKH